MSVLGRSGRRCRCTIEGYELERLQRDVSSDFTRVSTAHPPARRRRGGHRRGRHLRRRGPGRPAGGRGRPAARRQVDARRVLRSRRDARPLAAAGAAALERALSPLGVRIGGAGPRAAPERACRCTRRWAASRGRSTSSSRCGSASRRRSRRSRSAWTRYPTLKFKLDPVSGWDEELIAALVATGAVDSVDFKGMYVGTVVDQPADPVLYRRVVEALPGRLDRGPEADAGDRGGPRRRPRPDHLGRDHPHRRRRQGAPVRAEDDQRQAVARRRPAPALRRSTSTARSTGSSATAAASSSSASAAARSSTWRRSSTRTPPTTSPRAATTTSNPPTACPRARCRSRRIRRAFAGARPAPWSSRKRVRDHCAVTKSTVAGISSPARRSWAGHTRAMPRSNPAHTTEARRAPQTPIGGRTVTARTDAAQLRRS